MNISSSLGTSALLLLGATLSPLSLPAQELVAPAARPISQADLPTLKAAAQGGDAEAQYRLGMLYLFGLYVPTDYKKSMAWHEKAALQGHVFAQYEWGSYLRRHKRDRLEANLWFGKAFAGLQEKANQGDVHALFILGDLYSHSGWVPRDEKKAEQLIFQALPIIKVLAEKGDFTAQCILATLNSSGIYIPDADLISYTYLNKLADQGSSTAQSFLAMDMLNMGRSEESISLARQAVANNCPLAAHLLIAYDRKKLIKASDEELLTWFEIMENQYLDTKTRLHADEYARLKALKQASATSK